MRRKLFALASLGLGIVGLTTANVRAAGSSLTLDFSVTNPINSGYAFLFSDVASTQTFEGYAQLADVPVGTSSQSIVLTPASSAGTVPTTLDTNTPIDGVVLVGVYSADESTGITVGVSQTVGDAFVGESFAQAMAAISSEIPSETQVVTALENPTPTVLTDLSDEIGTPIAANDAAAIIGLGDTGALIDFTNGTTNGSLSASIATAPGGPSGGSTGVPLPPAAWSMLATFALIGAVTKIRGKMQSTAR